MPNRTIDRDTRKRCALLCARHRGRYVRARSRHPMITITRINIFAVVLLGTSCVGNSNADSPTQVEQESRAIFYRFGEGYTSAAIGLASPEMIKTVNVGGALTKESQNAGIWVSWLDSPNTGDKPTPRNLRVSRSGHLAYDIYIGKSGIADVQRRLGSPDEIGATWLTYRGLAEICSDSYTFKFVGDKLNEVEWKWCAD